MCTVTTTSDIDDLRHEVRRAADDLEFTKSRLATAEIAYYRALTGLSATELVAEYQQARERGLPGYADRWAVAGQPSIHQIKQDARREDPDGSWSGPVPLGDKDPTPRGLVAWALIDDENHVWRQGYTSFFRNRIKRIPLPSDVYLTCWVAVHIDATRDAKQAIAKIVAEVAG